MDVTVPNQNVFRFRWISPYLVIIILILVVSGCKVEHPAPVLAKYPGTVSYKISESENAFLDTVQHSTFDYFIHEINPQKVLIKDRSTETSPATIAAMGFAIPVWAIGAERNWISREKAAELTLIMLRFLIESKQSPDPVSTGYKGFYYHFLDMQEGLRFWNSELSTIDTAWLLAGIRFAVQYYNQDQKSEKTIRELGDALTFRVEWDFMTMPENGEHAYTISMGWTPEKGLHDMGWFGYNEALYLYILAAGSGYSSAPKAYGAWLKGYEWREPYPGLAHVAFPPLFGHQYTQLFLDLRGIADRYMKEKGIDYFENSRRATYVNRQYAIENPKGWVGYDSLTWGISASDGPGPVYNFNEKEFIGYAGRGTAGPEWTFFDDGTLTPTALFGSIVFAPEIVIPAAKSIYKRFADKGLWGRYGMVDAYNLTVKWFDQEYLGLDQGPIVIAIENLRTEMVWKYCMNDPVIQKGLKNLGFEKVKNLSPHNIAH